MTKSQQVISLKCANSDRGLPLERGGFGGISGSQTHTRVFYQSMGYLPFRVIATSAIDRNSPAETQQTQDLQKKGRSMAVFKRHGRGPPSVGTLRMNTEWGTGQQHVPTPI